jgi:hypothetical protein
LVLLYELLPPLVPVPVPLCVLLVPFGALLVPTRWMVCGIVDGL